jgi:hypothetical protein
MFDTNWALVSSFMPVVWDSGCSFQGERGTKVLFTLESLDNMSAKKRMLKPQATQYRMQCRSYRSIVGGNEIVMSKNCDTDFGGATSSLGAASLNNTRLVRQSFFTSADNFKVKEIEVSQMVTSRAGRVDFDSVTHRVVHRGKFVSIETATVKCITGRDNL